MACARHYNPIRTFAYSMVQDEQQEHMRLWFNPKNNNIDGFCCKVIIGCAGQEAFNLHSKDTVNDSTYLLLSSLAEQSLRKANIIKALAINLNLARPEKPPGSFVSPSSECKSLSGMCISEGSFAEHILFIAHGVCGIAICLCWSAVYVVHNLLLVKRLG